jgi:hypothetical protein
MATADREARTEPRPTRPMARAAGETWLLMGSHDAAAGPPRPRRAGRATIRRVTCDVCHGPLDPDEAHHPHEPGCPREGCACDLATHPGCCPECAARDV